jgi:hypothetical protein
MSDISVFVKARPFPSSSGVCVERHCRCGMCFDAEGRAVSVTADQLERLKADPMLVVTEVDAAHVAADAPQAETPEAPEPEAAKADAPATEPDKTAAKTADKKAG